MPLLTLFFHNREARTLEHREEGRYRFVCKVRNESAVTPQLRELPVSVYQDLQYQNTQYRAKTIVKIELFWTYWRKFYFWKTFSSALSIVIDESASGGRTSTSAFECLWSATEAEGLSSSRSIVERILKNKLIKNNLHLTPPLSKGIPDTAYLT